MLYRAAKQMSRLIVTFQSTAKEMGISIPTLRPALYLITQNMELICDKQTYDVMCPKLRLITNKEIDFTTFQTKLNALFKGHEEESKNIIQSLTVLRKLFEGDIDFYQQQFGKLLESSSIQLLQYITAIKKIVRGHVINTIMINDPLYIQSMEETKRIRMRYAESIRKKEAALQQSKTESVDEQKNNCDFVKGPS